MPALTIRVFKSWQVVDETNSWSNTYEIDGGTALTPSSEAARSIAMQIVGAEQFLHLTAVQFFKVIISTWGADGEIYNPSSFRTIPLEMSGSRSWITNAIDGNVTFYVRRAPITGRYGRLFYRGCLTEADVETGGNLASKLASGSSLNPQGEDFLSYRAELLPLMEGDTMGGRLALIGEYGDDEQAPVWLSRPVVNVASGGIVVNQRNHAWFDRSSLQANGS